MFRAQFKDKAYFDEAIDYEKNIIQKYKGYFNHNDMEVRMNFSIGLVDKYLGMLYLRYSRGDAISEMKADVEEILHYRKLQKHYADLLPDQQDRVQWERITTERLSDAYEWLAFALAVGVSDDYIHDALALIGLQGQDRILDLIAYQLGDTQRPISDKLWDKKSHGKLLKAIESPKEKQGNAMIHAINKWYGVCGLKDFHLRDNDAYDGYWCCEAALVTRVFAMDDSAYRDHPYYPKDLV